MGHGYYSVDRVSGHKNIVSTDDGGILISFAIQYGSLNGKSYFATYKKNKTEKDITNIEGTQKVFNHRAKMCSLAAQGKWSVELESQ